MMEQDPYLAVKRSRTRSWVGVEEEKPHAYLREAMYEIPLDLGRRMHSALEWAMLMLCLPTLTDRSILLQGLQIDERHM